MNARQLDEANALLGAADYSAARLADFTHVPPTPVDLKFASARTLVTQAIADLGGKQSIQSGGGYRQDSARQAALRDGLEENLGDIRITASAIAAETSDPALMTRFRLPDGRAGRVTALPTMTNVNEPPTPVARFLRSKATVK